MGEVEPAYVDDLAAEAQKLKSLGSGDSGFGEKTASYNPGILESFPNRDPDAPYWIRLLCEEFTSICPKTGQPDFATIFINYIPAVLCVESKSLKLYLHAFRNHGVFHESVINMIARDLSKLLSPRYLEVYGVFNPRGGIAIYPFVQKNDSTLQYVELAEKRRDELPVVPAKEPILR